LQGAERAVVESADVHIARGQEIEAAVTATEELNEQRRQHVVQQLLAQGVVDADLRVVVEPVDRVGVRGIEAPRVYNGLFQRGGIGGGLGGQQGGLGGGQGGLGGGLGGGGGIGGGFF
jgi:hypothetical protein